MKTIVVALAVAVVGGVLMVLEAVFQPAHLAYAWHAAATFGLTVCLGGFFLDAVLVNAGTKWSANMRHVHGAIGGALPIACLAYIPILHISKYVALDVAYLVVAVAFEEAMRAASLHGRKRAGIGAAGMVVVCFAMSAFFFDVTLTPSRPWVSDIFALYMLVGAFGAALGATACVSALDVDALRLTASHASAVGRLLLVVTCLWAYCAFSLYMLIWIADLPREVRFFVPRTVHAWGWMLDVLVFGRFVVPFLMLIPHEPKRHWWQVGVLGAVIVVAHALDCEMMIGPSSARGPSALDLGSFLVVGGVCALVAVLRFRRHAALPVAADVDRALAYEAS